MVTLHPMGQPSLILKAATGFPGHGHDRFLAGDQPHVAHRVIEDLLVADRLTDPMLSVIFSILGTCITFA